MIYVIVCYNIINRLMKIVGHYCSLIEIFHILLSMLVTFSQPASPYSTTPKQTQHRYPYALHLRGCISGVGSGVVWWFGRWRSGLQRGHEEVCNGLGPSMVLKPSVMSRNWTDRPTGSWADFKSIITVHLTITARIGGVIFLFAKLLVGFSVWMPVESCAL